VEMLGKARELLPQRARIHYNYGLTLQHLNRRAEAETALLAAHQLEPKDAEVLHALAIFYIQAQHWDSAATYAEQLARLYPNAPEPRQMLNWIRQHQGR